jgi:hypothetical protein
MAGAITNPIFTGNRARHTIAQAKSNSREQPVARRRDRFLLMKSQPYPTALRYR